MNSFSSKLEHSQFLVRSPTQSVRLSHLSVMLGSPQKEINHSGFGLKSHQPGLSFQKANGIQIKENPSSRASSPKAMLKVVSASRIDSLFKQADQSFQLSSPKSNLNSRLSTMPISRDNIMQLSESKIKLQRTKNDLLEMKPTNKFTSNNEEETRTNRLVMKAQLQDLVSNINSESAKSANPSDSFKDKFNLFKLKMGKSDFQAYGPNKESSNEEKNNNLFNLNSGSLHSKHISRISSCNRDLNATNYNPVKVKDAFNDILLNSKEGQFFEKKHDLLNQIKSKRPSLSNSNSNITSPRCSSPVLGSGFGTNLFKKSTPMSLGLLEKNLSNNKESLMNYYHSKSKINTQSTLLDSKFSKTQNKICKLLTKI